MGVLRTARVILLALLPLSASAQNADVSAVVATPTYSSSATAPASAAVWPHPSDPARSVLLIADPAAGLLVSPLDGGALSQLSGGSWAGISVREQFPWAGTRVTMLAASQLDDGVVELFTLDEDGVPTLRGAVNPGAGRALSGTALTFDPATLEAWLFVSDSASSVQQFALQQLSDGGVVGTPVRTLPQSSRASQLTTDIENGRLFVVEDAVGVWSYDVDPFSGTSRTLVAGVGTSLFAPVGGVAVYPSSFDTGYLLVAAPSDDRVHLFEKEGAFTPIGTLRGIDPGTSLAANAPNAIALFNRPAGGFDGGLVAIEDRSNNSRTARFLLLPWPAVAEGFDPPLTVDTRIQPARPDGGTDGVGDGGTDGEVDGGGGGSGGGVDPNLPRPGGSFPDPEDPPASGCGCQSTPATALLLLGCLSGLLLRWRRES